MESKIMNKKGRFNEERAFGVEIECLVPIRYRYRGDANHNKLADDLLEATGLNFRVGGYHRTYDEWKITGDSSVRSLVRRLIGNVEIVSPPLKGRDGLAEVKRVMDALVSLGAEVNRTCGLHVHHDCNEWKRMARRGGRALNIAIKKVRYLVTLVARYEHVIYSLLPLSRLTGTYAKKMSSCYADDSWLKDYETKTMFTSTSNAKRNKSIRNFLTATDFNAYHRIMRGMRRASFQIDRFSGLNFFAWYRQGTVEFRYGAGTVNGEKAINWIIFTQLFVNMASVRADQNRRITMNSAEPFSNAAERKISLGHLKVVLGITRSGMDARQGIVRDDEVVALDSWLTKRQNQFAGAHQRNLVADNRNMLTRRMI
jgi:hypothetical protein|tara:strand:+ start:314 stop:1423 length:1110 start_codon:yes stop_codon:yes gene_type:complete